MIRLPRVFTIPPGVPFARTLAESLWHEHRDDLLALSDIEIYLPNRRSVIAMTDAFLEASEGQAAMLPRMIPIGDIDEDDLFETDPFVLEDTPGLLPAISPVERNLILTQLLLKRADIHSVHQAHALSVELSRLIDRAHTESIDLTKIDTLVTGDLATHWQKTTEFLNIITKVWPDILADRGQMDPAQRRNLILRQKAKLLLEKQPKTRMIAAGSTGSIPATAEFLNAVARMKNGNVILPGFDPKIDKETWDAIDFQHPFYFMKKLIGVFSIDPRQVKYWDGVRNPHKTQCDLQDFVLSALRPKEIFDLTEVRIKANCLDDHQFIHADNPLHEARLISVILRDAIQNPHQTMMVVTPDRELAKSLQSEMLRWDVHVNDSGGETLDKTPSGIFLRLVAQFPSSVTPSTSAMAILNHPHTRLDESDNVESLNQVERVLRQNILPVGGLPALAEKYDLQLLKDFLAIMQLPGGYELPLQDWLHWHIAAAEKLSLHSADNPSNLWRHDDGEAAAQMFHNLLLSEHIRDIALTLHDYEQLLTSWMQQVTLRPRHRLHPRIRVLSPIEARLQHADVTILAGLNEDVWPSRPNPNPWLSRPMERELGFEDSERRIGQSTLDFVILFCAQKVYVTWSKQREGVLAQPSRWLQQISAVLKKNNMPLQPEASNYYHWSRVWDAPPRITPLPSPEPRPALQHRPHEFSVTNISDWQKDPYGFYAEKILNLRPLPLLDRGIDHKEWGIVVHNSLDYFFGQNGFEQANPQTYFRNLSRDLIDEYNLNPSQRLQWESRLHVIGDWIISRQTEAQQSMTEFSFRYDFTPFDGQSFTLNGRADRVDITSDGIVLTDYKTGKPPSGKAVQTGKSPQLPLLGLMASSCNDSRLKDKPLAALHYVHLMGRTEKPAELRTLKDTGKLIDDNKKHLYGLLQRYYVHNAGYTAKILASNDYDDYAQLKRVAEWAAVSNDTDEAEWDEADA